jgi:predicted DNA-binding transcriptional regulator AlpA
MRVPAIRSRAHTHQEGGTMTTTTLPPETFGREVDRRLIDTFELMLLLGLRSKRHIWKRVEAGTLPPPVFTRENQIALWDRDALPT